MPTQWLCPKCRLPVRQRGMRCRCRTIKKPKPRKLYNGDWVVYCSDLLKGRDRAVNKAESEQEARDDVRRLNADNPLHWLYWCEQYIGR